MLNISDQSVSAYLPRELHAKIDDEKLPRGHQLFRIWLISIFVLAFLFLFLPWQQNIRAYGTVIPLDPSQRPQTVNATIGGGSSSGSSRKGST